MQIFYAESPVPEYLKASVETVIKIHESQPEGDVLLFLTGQEQVETVCKWVWGDCRTSAIWTSLASKFTVFRFDFMKMCFSTAGMWKRSGFMHFSLLSLPFRSSNNICYPIHQIGSSVNWFHIPRLPSAVKIIKIFPCNPTSAAECWRNTVGIWTTGLVLSRLKAPPLCVFTFCLCMEASLIMNKCGSSKELPRITERWLFPLTSQVRLSLSHRRKHFGNYCPKWDWLM